MWLIRSRTGVCLSVRFGHATQAPPALMDESVPYTKRKLESLLSLDYFEQAALRYLPRVLFAYVSGGVETNASMDQNRAVFEELGFIPRVMRDVSNVDIQVDLWGQTYATPFGIAPMGLSALTAYQGDLVQARAAHRFNEIGRAPGRERGGQYV